MLTLLHAHTNVQYEGCISCAVYLHLALSACKLLFALTKCCIDHLSVCLPICRGCPCLPALRRHLLDCTVAVVCVMCGMQIFVFFPDAAKVGVKDIKV